MLICYLCYNMLATSAYRQQIYNPPKAAGIAFISYVAQLPRLNWASGLPVASDSTQHINKCVWCSLSFEWPKSNFANVNVWDFGTSEHAAEQQSPSAQICRLWMYISVLPTIQRRTGSKCHGRETFARRIYGINPHTPQNHRTMLSDQWNSN